MNTIVVADEMTEDLEKLSIFPMKSFDKKISLQECLELDSNEIFFAGCQFMEPCARCGLTTKEHVKEELRLEIDKEAKRFCIIFNGHPMLFPWEKQHEIIKEKWRAVAKAALSGRAG